MNSKAQPTTVQPESPYNRSVHALSVILTIAVFPLIWVGSLVTTYDAGMAVPDWPGTYGWNMFAYPATTWIYGPFDLLVEHSHRLLGSLAGFLAIGLVVTAFLFEQRRWFRWWTVFVLLFVIGQGVLGGLRVLLDQRAAALLHGCIGPLFFALATATAVMSSRWWLSAAANSSERRSGRGVIWLATLLVLVSYVQLIVGAQLRHVTGATAPKAFAGFVHVHLTLAGLVLILTLLLAAFAGLSRRTPERVSTPSLLLVLLVFAQIALGIATWIVNYALPWQELNASLAAYIVQAKGYSESLIVSAHVATGSLIISLATVAALRACRSKTAAHSGAKA